jgi:hypothetical protein
MLSKYVCQVNDSWDRREPAEIWKWIFYGLIDEVSDGLVLFRKTYRWIISDFNEIWKNLIDDAKCRGNNDWTNRNLGITLFSLKFIIQDRSIITRWKKTFEYYLRQILLLIQWRRSPWASRLLCTCARMLQNREPSKVGTTQNSSSFLFLIFLRDPM